MLVRIRSGLRLARVGLHLAYGLGTAAVVYPWVARAAQLKLQQDWSRNLLAMLGLRLRVSGASGQSSFNAAGGMVVSNHISWLDVFVIGSLAPATFVCKSEVRHWPLIGFLCARTGTVFLERGSRSAAQRANRALAGKLGQGERIVVFPEGTTTDGTAELPVLPFRAALLQSAIDAGAPVQPLVLRYLDARGGKVAAAAYCGETTFWQSLCAIASAPPITASVRILETVTTEGGTRRNLAARTHALILASFGQPDIHPGNPIPEEQEGAEEFLPEFAESPSC